MSRFTLLGVGAGAQNRTEAIGLQVRCSTFELRRQGGRVPGDGCCPVFPGCHVFCRPATYHGIEPPPFLPSLDKRAGIEPALSLLVAGGDSRLAKNPDYIASSKHLRAFSCASPLCIHQHRSGPDLNRLYQACGAQRYAIRLPGCYPSTPPLRCWPPSFRGVRVQHLRLRGL